MNEKKINIAAKEYANTIYISFKYRILRRLIFNTFVYAVNWFLSNLWHDTSEEPKENTDVIVQAKFDNECYSASYSCGEYVVKDVHHDDNNIFYVKDIIHWLYIDDLLKGGK